VKIEMPKLIPNVRERLASDLEELLRKEPGNASIRALARRSGIAVGTIYNYFPDKEALVNAAFEKQWLDIVQRAEKAILSAPTRRRALINSVDSIYRDVEQMHQVARRRRDALGRMGVATSRSLPGGHPMWQRLANASVPLLSLTLSLTDSEARRAAIATIAATHQLIQAFPTTPEENKRSLRRMLQGIGRPIPRRRRLRREALEASVAQSAAEE
jgi:AcrR family transcriptional regulator